MTHRKSSNVCPVCGAQGKMVAITDRNTARVFVDYVVCCKCDRRIPEQQSKKWAWWWFRNWHTVKMRNFKNYPRQFTIRKREDIRAGRLTRAAVGLRLHNAWLRNS